MAFLFEPLLCCYNTLNAINSMLHLMSTLSVDSGVNRSLFSWFELSIAHATPFANQYICLSFVIIASLGWAASMIYTGLVCKRDSSKNR